jgi:hypothetical protein
MKRRKPRKPPEYPIGTVAIYGPDNKTTPRRGQRRLRVYLPSEISFSDRAAVPDFPLL